MLELADELPDSSPRFVLLSYPLTLVCFPASFLFSDLSICFMNSHIQPNFLMSTEQRREEHNPRTTDSRSFFSTFYLRTPLFDTHLLQPSGRLSVPYVLLYYLPVNCNPNMRMSYAGAVELMRSTAEVNRVLEVADAEELQDIEDRLKGED